MVVNVIFWLLLLPACLVICLVLGLLLEAKMSTCMSCLDSSADICFLELNPLFIMAKKANPLFITTYFGPKYNI